jgi:hypothetical protein
VILIKKLNEILRGWANYHRHVVSSEAFKRVDNYVYDQLWRMLHRRRIFCEDFTEIQKVAGSEILVSDLEENGVCSFRKM